jgi:polyhydroxybutyrate depolymerase
MCNYSLFMDTNNRSAIMFINSLTFGFLLILSFFTLFPKTNIQAAEQTENGASYHSIQSSGVQRSYLLYIPKSYRGDPTSLVFNFHGSGGEPRGQLEYSDFARLSEQYGFILVLPVGAYTNSVTSQSWNANLDPQGVDDVQFVRDILANIAGFANMDSNRIYTTGMSGGARMSSRLACELADVLAAAAPVAGIQYPDDCSLGRAMPILTFHGKADAVNQYELGENSRPYWLMGVETAVEKWRLANKCSEETDSASISNVVTLYTWKDCAGNAEIQFYVIEDGGHTWPGSPITRRGLTNQDINASELIWEFFSQHSLP